MPYSAPAIALRKPKVVELPRGSDRISYLYVDCARITQERTGLTASWDTEQGASQLVIPVAGLSLLLIGGGVSITSAAMATLYNNGCTAIFTGLQGMTTQAVAAPLNSRADWAQAQARVWADPQLRLEAARRMYVSRFPGLVFPENAPLKTLRGIEGQQVKTLYRQMSAVAGLRNWKREADVTLVDDPVNPLLNLANSLLYGVALSACSALGLSPALGVIHQGSIRALLFDLADMYKADISIPVAFRFAKAGEGAAAMVRREMRTQLHQAKVFESMLNELDVLFGDHRHAADKDTLLDENGLVPGMRNYYGDQ